MNAMFNSASSETNVAPNYDPRTGLLRFYLCLQYAYTALLDTLTVIAFLCYNVLMELYIPPASPRTSCQGLS